MDTLIYFIFSFAVYIKISDGSYGCDQSIPTIAYVASCPKNKAEWDIAARRKNCESLGAHQNCTKPNSNFQYHCLENQWQNMTLEICAPIFYLQGYCAKYSTDKKRVEENYVNGFECLNFDESEKCPSRYPSTDAYKYQRCYKLKYQNPTQTACPICTLPSQSPQSGTTPIETMEEFGSDTDDSIKTVFLVILAVALPGVVLFFILFYKRKSLNLERFCKVLTCDVETGPNNGTKKEENTQHEEQENEVHESSRLLSDETGSDEQDFAVVLNSSSNAKPEIGIVLASAPISSDFTHSSSIEVPSSTPRVKDDPKKLNSNKDIVSNISDNVPTSGQTSDIVTASKQEPVDDTSSKPKPDNEIASIQNSNTFLNLTSNSDTEGIMISKSDDYSLSKPKPIDVSLPQVKSDAKNTSKPSKSENEPTDISIPENNEKGDKSRDASKKKFKENPPKSNDGHSLKPVSSEKIASKSTSLEALDSRQVSNGKSAADPVSASHTSSSSGFPFKSTKEDTKKVVIDDPKVISTSMPAESPESLPFNKSSTSLSKKNTFGSKAPDNSVTSFDQISQNGKDAPKPVLQYPAAAKSTSKDVPASDDAPVLATDNSAPGNGSFSNPMSKNNPFDEDTKPSALSNSNPAPDSTASKPMSENNPFHEDSTPSETSDKDPALDDSTTLEPNPGNNPFEEVTPPSEFGKSKKAPRPPPHVTKINVPQHASFRKKAPPPPRPQGPPKNS